jgi:hypothetical protein
LKKEEMENLARFEGKKKKRNLRCKGVEFVTDEVSSPPDISNELNHS